MVTRRKKILRGLDVAGDSRFDSSIQVVGSSQFFGVTRLNRIDVDGTSEFSQNVTISSPDPNVVPSLTLDGVFINDQFFPLNKFDGTPVDIAVNGGVVIAGVDGALNRYFINRGPLAKNVTTSTVFSAANGWGEWFSGSGGGNTDVCKVAVNIGTLDIDWVDDTQTELGSNIRWNQNNTGFEWDLRLTNARITQLCNHVLTQGLPITFTSSTTVGITALTLNGTDILSDVTTSATGNGINITYNKDRDGVDPDLTINPNLTQTNSFRLTATLTLAGAEVKDTNGFDPTFLLFYTPPAATISISTSPLRFDGEYTTATISRTFNGNPTSFTSTSFPNATITAGATNITFPTLNRTSPAANRTVTEITSYTNATNTSDVLALTRTATINPTFTFPVYLGNVTAAENSSLTAALFNMTSRFTRFGNFTSTPGDQTYSWPNTGDASRDIRVFAVATRFTNGRNITVRPFDGGFPSTVSRQMQLALGDVVGATENYDIYIVQSGSPGAGTLFIEL